MDKQLRRYKRRLKDHHRDRTEPVEHLLLYPRLG
jgi:ribosome-associated translation inhibitor RaiA